MLIVHKSSLGSYEVPHKIWARVFISFYFNCEHFLFVYIVKQNQKKLEVSKKIVDILIQWKSKFVAGKFLKFVSFLNMEHVKSHKNVGPDRFSCFDVYWIKKNRQDSQMSESHSNQIPISVNSNDENPSKTLLNRFYNEPNSFSCISMNV